MRTFTRVNQNSRDRAFQRCVTEIPLNKTNYRSEMRCLNCKKNPPAKAGDIRTTSSIPGLGRSPGGGRVSLLQYSWPGKSHGQRSLAGYTPRVARSRTWLKQLISMHTHNCKTSDQIVADKNTLSSKENSKNTKKAEMKWIYSSTTTGTIFGISKCQRKSTKSVTKTDSNNELDLILRY